MNKTNKTVLAYVEKDNCYLMLFRNKKENDINKNKWIGVGGHVEIGESVEKALTREIKEETGLDVISYQKRGLIYFHYDDIKEDMHLFVVKEVKGTLIDCDEGTLKYIPKDEILNLELWEGDKIFLKYLLTDKPYFELELNYLKDKLVSYRFIQ